MLHVIFREGLVDLGHLAARCDGLEDLRELAARWSPQRAAVHAGVEEETIARLARELAAAPRAVVYGRVGVCQQQTGSLTHWLINVLNTVTGNMDSVGGAMFPTPPVDLAALVDRLAGSPHRGQYTQRVSGLPEFADELPVAGLAEELSTPGEGQVRGMLIYAGNPVLSTPGGGRLDAAMDGLEWCVAVDMYVTETTRHADVILPPLAQLERDDLDIVFPAFSVRNQIRYNPAALPAPSDGKDDWEILSELTTRIGRGAVGTARNLLLRIVGPLASFDRVIDLALRTGPYGRLRSRRSLDIGKVKRSRHGIDLGPLQPSLVGRLQTTGKRVRLAPAVLMDEAARLEELAGEREIARSDGFDLTLIGRRSLRSNNSWMHNSPRLMKGADRCTAMLHPDDAEQRGLTDGQRVRVASSVGAIELPLELSDEMRQGVISIPHGFGHKRKGVGWRVAAEHGGASVNDVTDPAIVDRLTGNAAFNDVPVRIEAVAERADAGAELDAVGA
jgi:anaerobic selenocysteine-containing dehydrogenase